MEERTQKVKRRLKIEFYPPFVAIALILIVLFLLFDNRGYWEMFNGIISGAIGFDANFVVILLIVLFVILGLCVSMLIFGLIGKLQWVHVPILHSIPLIFLIIINAVLFFAFQISDRIGLDYIFFSLGPGKAEALYIGVSIAVFVFLAISMFALRNLYQSPTKIETEGRVIRFHPKFITISTSLSILFSMPLFLMLLFDYATTGVYWDNIGVIFKKFMDWNPIFVILYIFGVIMVICAQIPMNRIEISTKIKTSIKVLGIFFQLSSIIYWAVSIEHSTNPYFSLLSVPLILFGLAFLLIQFSKLIEAMVNRVVRIPKLQSMKYAKSIVVMMVIFIPYFGIFYHPLISGPLGVDAPPVSYFQTINGIEVPFQGRIAYPSFEMQSNETRKYINLTDNWKYWKGTGSDSYSSAPRTNSTIAKLTQGQHLPNFDDSNWQSVKVPHTISFYEDDVKYWGVVWYRRAINIDESFSNLDLYLKFFGVNYYCDVWIDGTWIGFHEGMYTAFAFDVTEYLTPGAHIIAVRVDHPQWGRNEFYNRIVPDGFDLFNHGGIEREIILEAVPKLSIVRTDLINQRFQTENQKNGSITTNISIVLKNSLNFSLANLSLAIYPLEFPNTESMMDIRTWNFVQFNQNATPIIFRSLPLAQISVGKYAALSLNLEIPFVRFWSTKTPHLYAINVNISTTNGIINDTFYTQTGFRNFSVDGNRLLLNGAPLKLAGVSIHEQYPSPIARMLNDSLRFSDLLKIKDLNANWWRAHYPLHPHSYIFSDRLGLACWEEAPINWVNEADFVQMYSRNYFYGLWTEILYRDYNRPSVLMWGATNEPWAQAALYRYLKDLHDWMKTKDPTRFVSFAAVSSHDSWTKGFEHLEICTPNTYAGTFEGNKTDWYNELTKQLWRVANNTYNRGKPIVSMEFGYWRSGINDSDQVRCFEEAFRAFSEHPNVQGMTWWIFADYHGPDYYNSMGIYNQERSWKSPTYDLMKAKYGEFTANNL